MKKRRSILPLVALALACAASPAACTPPGPGSEPVPDMSMVVRWAIGGEVPDELLCRALDPGTVDVELWEDSDCDGSLRDGYYIYAFSCDGGLCVDEGGEHHGEPCGSDEDCGGGEGSCVKGAGKTPDYFFSDTPTCLQLVLVSHYEDEEQDDLVLAWTADFQGGVCRRWCELGYCYDTYEDCPEDCWCEAETGGGRYPDELPACDMGEAGAFEACRDLGTVSFDLAAEAFGPLRVALSWQKSDATFGLCEEAEAAFAAYTLERRYEIEDEGTVYRTLDEVTMEDGAPCRDELSWRLVPFGFYRLTVEGRSAGGSVVWQAECEDESGGDIEVDNSEENHFDCLVERL
jgi:hypothetical protein